MGLLCFSMVIMLSLLLLSFFSFCLSFLKGLIYMSEDEEMLQTKL